MIGRMVGQLLGGLALGLLLTPLLWAAWVSFTPDELLRPPIERWSLRWYLLFFGDSRWVNSLFHSLLVALGSTCIALLTGSTAALAVSRDPSLRQRWLDRLILLPLCVPPVVLAMGLLPTMHLLGLWGSFSSLMLSHALLGMPLVFLAVRANLQSLPVELEQAARGLGAGPWLTFFRITLPLCRPGLLTGSLLCFVLSLNEFYLALFLGTPQTETLPRIIWPQLRYSLSPLVAVASMLTLLVTLAAGSLALLRRWR